MNYFPLITGDTVLLKSDEDCKDKEYLVDMMFIFDDNSKVGYNLIRTTKEKSTSTLSSILNNRYLLFDVNKNKFDEFVYYSYFYDAGDILNMKTKTFKLINIKLINRISTITNREVKCKDKCSFLKLNSEENYCSKCDLCNKSREDKKYNLECLPGDRIKIFPGNGYKYYGYDIFIVGIQLRFGSLKYNYILESDMTDAVKRKLNDYSSSENHFYFAEPRELKSRYYGDLLKLDPSKNFEEKQFGYIIDPIAIKTCDYSCLTGDCENCKINLYRNLDKFEINLNDF